MSALRDLGLIRLNPENSRHHVHVEGMGFAQVALAAVSKASSADVHVSKPHKGRKPRFPRPLPKGRDLNPRSSTSLLASWLLACWV